MLDLNKFFDTLTDVKRTALGALACSGAWFVVIRMLAPHVILAEPFYVGAVIAVVIGSLWYAIMLVLISLVYLTSAVKNPEKYMRKEIRVNQEIAMAAFVGVMSVGMLAAAFREFDFTSLPVLRGKVQKPTFFHFTIFIFALQFLSLSFFNTRYDVIKDRVERRNRTKK